MLINKSLLKYGYSNFSLEILEYCKPEDCTQREQYYLNLLEPEYNILTLAGSLLGYKHTEETKVKFKHRIRSSGNKGKKLNRLYTEEEKLKFVERIAKAREIRKNEGIIFKHKEETKIKISKARLGKIHSEETKLKMVGNKGKITRVTDLTTKVITEFVSLRKAAEFMDTSLDTVRRYIKDKKILKNRYKIENNP